MDERDKDLTHLFVRDLDEIPLPPRGEWRRAQGRESIAMKSSRYLLTVGAIVAVLAVALIVGFQLRDRSVGVANPSASPTPALTSLPNVVPPSPTANPNVAPTPCVGSTCPGGPPPNSAVFNDDFGFIVSAGDIAAANIRKESSSARIGSFASQDYAVSPDGRQVAYWRASSGGSLLDVYTVSSGNARTIIGLSTQGGGAIAWSSDGTGVVVAANSADSSASGGPTSQLITVDVASGDHVQIAKRTDGRLYWPLAWNRGLNVVAGGVTGEGGFMTEYFTIDTIATASATKSFPVQGRTTIGSVHVTNDTKWVLGVDIDTNAISYWPLFDYSQAKTVPVATAGKAGALWRPTTHQIGFIASSAFWLYDVDLADPQIGSAWFTVQGGSLLRTFRADGRAVVLAVPVSTTDVQAGTSYTLSLLGDPPVAPKSIAANRVTFPDSGGLQTSVRIR